MTVSSTTNKVSYNCDGSQTQFTFNFKIYQDKDLTVVLTDAAGEESTLTLTSDYTVSGAGDENGGSISTTQTYASGNKITILRELELKQETNYEEGGSFPAESHENALDKLTMICQQLVEAIGRALKLPVSSQYSDLQLPDPTGAAGKALVWNETEDGLESSDLAGPQGPQGETGPAGMGCDPADLTSANARKFMRIKSDYSGLEPALIAGKMAGAAKTADYTMTDNDMFICAVPQSNNVTITLPSASTHRGLVIIQRGVDSAYTLTVQRQGGDTIDGDGRTSITIDNKWEPAILFSDGLTYWRRLHMPYGEAFKHHGGGNFAMPYQSRLSVGKHSGGTQYIANGVSDILTWEGGGLNPRGEMETTNWERFTAEDDGIYLNIVHLQCTWNPTATGQYCYGNILLNSANSQGYGMEYALVTGSHNFDIHWAKEVSMGAGDYLEITMTNANAVNDVGIQGAGNTYSFWNIYKIA